MRKVVVIGESILSSLGDTPQANFEAVCRGESALRRYEGMFGVKEPFVASLMDRTLWQVEGRTFFDSVVYEAARRAVEAAGIDPSSPRTAFVLSSIKGNIEHIDTQDVTLAVSARRLADAFGNPNPAVVVSSMHNNDPRIVKDTEAVRHLHFEEAAELAYFGAKILHPTCIQPARYENIPVRLLNTMEPDAPGTLINNIPEPGTIKAVAAKDNSVAIKIKSSRMLLAHGFLRKVFEIFESYRTSIDIYFFWMSRRWVRRAIFCGSDCSATYFTCSDITYSCVLPGQP